MELNQPNPSRTELEKNGGDYTPIKYDLLEEGKSYILQWKTNPKAIYPFIVVSKTTNYIDIEKQNPLEQGDEEMITHSEAQKKYNFYELQTDRTDRNKKNVISEIAAKYNPIGGKRKTRKYRRNTKGKKGKKSKKSKKSMKGKKGKKSMKGKKSKKSTKRKSTHYRR